MSRAFGYITLIVVVAVGAWFYMRQTQGVMSGGTKSPTATVDLIGVHNDLLSMAQAERAHAALHGGYVSLDELHAQGELTMRFESRGPYTYSAETNDGGFRIIATYSGPDNSGLPKTISIDQTMAISHE